MGSPSYDFSGRHVLVTGGARGLGHLLARSFARHGARVTITGTQSATSYYDADLSGFGYHPLDLTDGDSITRLVEAVGHLDVLVNSAAPRLPYGIDAGEREFIAHAARIGLVGPLQLATRLRLTLAHSTARGGGAIVNMPATRRWLDLTVGSQVTDLEIEQLTQRIGGTWARLGVRVNSITASEMVPTQRSGLSVRIDHGSAPLMTRTQVPGVITQREIVDVALFLASDGAAGLAGQTLTVGASAQQPATTLF